MSEEVGLSGSENKPSYNSLRADFRWKVPAYFNIGVACVDRWRRKPPRFWSRLAAGSKRSRSALSSVSRTGSETRSSRKARGRALESLLFFHRDSRPRWRTWPRSRLAGAVPLSVLFGYEALQHRLTDSGADRHNRPEDGWRGSSPSPKTSTRRDRHRRSGESAPPRIRGIGRGGFGGAGTRHDLGRCTCLIIYTSGTTGSSKGALHAHRVLLGHQPGFQLSHDRFPQAGDRFWTPADWAWIGGLMNGLFSSWFHGRPIAAAVRAGFDPEWAVAVIKSAGIRNVFLPPTALRLMRAAEVQLPKSSLRTVMSGGEVLGKETHAWAQQALGVSVKRSTGRPRRTTSSATAVSFGRRGPDHGPRLSGT